MAVPISFSVPVSHLRELEFLLGEFSGLETLYSPDGLPVQFTSHVTGSWESCDRYFMLSFYGEIPGVGIESRRAMITYGADCNCYRMWFFESTHEDPMYMEGDFREGCLVMISDPTKILWGTHRLRYSFTPHLDGSVEFLAERWEPDGYAKHCSAIFRSIESF